MRTFEEALATVAVLDTTPSPERAQKFAEELKIGAARFAEIMDEAANSPVLLILLAALETRSCCAYHAQLNSFLAGLRVGIEMERQDGGVIMPEMPNT